MTGAPAPARTRRRGDAALGRLLGVAHRDKDGASYVAVLLETAADVAERREDTEALPETEQRLWEASGARFDDTASVPRAKARMATAFADLAGRSIHGDAALAKILGVDRSRISQRVSERSLYAFSTTDDRYFPRWQIHGRRTLPHLKVVLETLDAHLHPLSVDHWFTSPNVDLVVGDDLATPVEWLTTGGDPAVVAELAADV